LSGEIKELDPRQTIQDSDQAPIGSRIIAKRSISAIQGCAGKCYGGDHLPQKKRFEAGQGAEAA